MSDTMDEDSAPILAPPDFSVTETERVTTPGSPPERVLTVAFGQPRRTIEVVELDLGAQFDLAEVTGTVPGNLEWRNMAFVAASIRMIDGVPVPAGSFTKRGLRGTLQRIGVDGLRAAGLALGGYGKSGQEDATETQEAHRRAVGN